jgi:multisubunit Na+/H+ antiporter MnhG subunit
MFYSICCHSFCTKRMDGTGKGNVWRGRFCIVSFIAWHIAEVAHPNFHGLFLSFFDWITTPVCLVLWLLCLSFSLAMKTV